MPKNARWFKFLAMWRSTVRRIRAEMVAKQLKTIPTMENIRRSSFVDIGSVISKAPFPKGSPWIITPSMNSNNTVPPIRSHSVKWTITATKGTESCQLRKSRISKLKVIFQLLILRTWIGKRIGLAILTKYQIWLVKKAMEGRHRKV